MTWLKLTELGISLDVFAKYSLFAFITKTENITSICQTITLRQGVEGPYQYLYGEVYRGLWISDALAEMAK